MELSKQEKIVVLQIRSQSITHNIQSACRQLTIEEEYDDLNLEALEECYETIEQELKKFRLLKSDVKSLVVVDEDRQKKFKDYCDLYSKLVVEHRAIVVHKVKSNSTGFLLETREGNFNVDLDKFVREVDKVIKDIELHNLVRTFIFLPSERQDTFSSILLYVGDRVVTDKFIVSYKGDDHTIADEEWFIKHMNSQVVDIIKELKEVSYPVQNRLHGREKESISKKYFIDGYYYSSVDIVVAYNKHLQR